MEEQPENSRRGNWDRISALPDCLLHLIMSFMTAREAVITSMLSKRWKNLWTTLPFLHFSLGDYTNADGRLIQDDNDKFQEFVSAALFLREPCDLLTFHLSCTLSDIYSIIRPWILYVLKHNPKVINISVSEWEALPLNIFTCSSLEDVSISLECCESSPRVINLPNLKRLYLSKVCLDEDFVKKLLCGCPLLENLHLASCNLQISTIQSQSLKYLAVESECGYEAKTLELINTPNLLSFYYSCCPYYIGHKVLLNMPSITDETIHIRRCHCCYAPTPNHECTIVIGISNVQNLKLVGWMIEGILRIELPHCPKFPSLKDLCVGGLCLNCHFHLLTSLLDHVPNLEKLSIRHCGFCCENYEEHGNLEVLKVARFQCNQLKTVEVQFCSIDIHYPRVVKYLQDSVDKLRARISI